MSEAKHTPGPWKADRLGWLRNSMFEVNNEEGERVAELVHGEANAQLISAAPDLLRELTAFHDFAIQLGIHECGQDGQPCPVQAAINKATGVTS